jgi:hypothetical protein
VVEVGDPDETARNLGAAIDRFLRSPPPTNVARRPTPAFDEAMLQAYAAAVGTSPR